MRVNRTTVGLLLLVGVAAAGCGRKVRHTPLEFAPEQAGARAELRVSEDAADNTVVTLQVQGLAAAGEPGPPRRVYVAWVRPEGREAAERVGPLGADGALRLVTPYRRFALFLTAEDEAAAEAPGGPVALRTEVRR
jgi:predicted small lipoprotein YifL